MDKLVVTGGLGFIGSNFIRYISQKKQDIQIINLDYQGPGGNPENLSDLKNNRRYRNIKADLSDLRVAERIADTADYIVNFAAETHVDRSIANPDPFLQSNVIATYNLLQSIRKNRPQKLVHISTDEVYGSAPTGSFHEESPLNPSSPYSATKAAGDMLVRAWTATYNLPTIILRCTNNFGPYQHPEKLIPKTIIRATKGLDIPLYGSGNQVRDWIYVQDFCTAIEKAMENGTVGETYNISAGNELTNRQVAEKVLAYLIQPPTRIVNVQDRPAHDFRYSLSSEKARKQLGWKPKHNFDDALGLTVKWYLTNEPWWKPLATNKILSSTPWKEEW